MYYLTMIIPAFNVDDCLDTAMDSIINQTIGFENIEVIIVDDCSTDNTRQIINGYAEKYDNCKGIFLEKNNGGAGIPRNVGIKQASSKYLMFIDPDDEWEKDACEVYYNKIVETGADLVYSHWTFVAGDKLSKTSHNFLKEEKEYVFEDNNDNIINYHKYYRPGMCAGIYDKQFVLNHHLECPNELGEDGYFTLETIFNAKKIVFIEYYGYYNKLRDTDEKTSITNIRDEEKFKSRINAVYLMYNLLKKYHAENNLFVVYDEMRVLIYQAYTLMPGISWKKRKIFFKEIHELENELNIKDFDVIHFKILNYFIAHEHYSIAAFISEILGRVYDSPVLRKMMRKVSFLISTQY